MVFSCQCCKMLSLYHLVIYHTCAIPVTSNFVLAFRMRIIAVTSKSSCRGSCTVQTLIIMSEILNHPSSNKIIIIVIRFSIFCFCLFCGQSRDRVGQGRRRADRPRNIATIELDRYQPTEWAQTGWIIRFIPLSSGFGGNNGSCSDWVPCCSFTGVHSMSVFFIANLVNFLYW